MLIIPQPFWRRTQREKIISKETTEAKTQSSLVAARSHSLARRTIANVANPENTAPRTVNARDAKTKT